MAEKDTLLAVRMRLVEAGGRASQDIGTGRISGQILVYLYLQEDECSLDDIAADLGLSKASVSIAVRKLEQLGLVRNIWKSGDKRKYYRSAENIAKALQQGILLLLHQRIQIFGDELDESLKMISAVSSDSSQDDDLLFVQRRIERAKKLQNGLEKILGNPLLKLLAKMNS
jgi:DNA-binding transcriptional regulator GbsR (MarR family)